MSFRMLPALTFVFITIGVLAAESRADWELSTDDTWAEKGIITDFRGIDNQ